jgi:hypothetical protein
MKRGGYGSKCRHCSGLNIDRRGLCRRCYRNLEIRKMYSILSPTRTGPGAKVTRAVKPDRRCKALPGTEERIAEYERRVSLGMEVFGERDA